MSAGSPVRLYRFRRSTDFDLHGLSRLADEVVAVGSNLYHSVRVRDAPAPPRLVRNR